MLVHRLRRAQGSARDAKSLLWPITRQTANRQVGAIMRGAGIEGPQTCPRGLRHSFGVAAVTAGVPRLLAACERLTAPPDAPKSWAPHRPSPALSRRLSAPKDHTGEDLPR